MVFILFVVHNSSFYENYRVCGVDRIKYLESVPVVALGFNFKRVHNHNAIIFF